MHWPSSQTVGGGELLGSSLLILHDTSEGQIFKENVFWTHHLISEGARREMCEEMSKSRPENRTKTWKNQNVKH